MKWVVIAVIGWVLVMASVFLVGNVLDSARRMLSSPAGSLRVPPPPARRAAPVAQQARTTPDSRP